MFPHSKLLKPTTDWYRGANMWWPEMSDEKFKLTYFLLLCWRSREIMYTLRKKRFTIFSLQVSFLHEILSVPHPPIRLLQHSAKVFFTKCSLSTDLRKFLPQKFPSIQYYLLALVVCSVYSDILHSVHYSKQLSDRLHGVALQSWFSSIPVHITHIT